MNNRRNRIIAREFLVFIAFLIIEVSLYSFIYLYNSYQKSQIEITNESIIQKNKFINNTLSPINKKKKNQDWFFMKISSEFDVSDSPYAKSETLWQAIERIAINDSIEYRWNNKWSNEYITYYKKIGFKSGGEFQNFILKNSLNLKDSTDLKNIPKFQKEIVLENIKKKELNKRVFNSKQVTQTMFQSALIFFSLLFILRYLFYGIKWSFQTLKQ